MPQSFTAPRRESNGPREVIRFNDQYYVLESVVAISKQSKVFRASLADLKLGQATILSPNPNTPPSKEVLCVMRGKELVVLFGKELIAAAEQAGSPDVPVRLISSFALKQAKA
jgi:hypothetical protein